MKIGIELILALITCLLAIFGGYKNAESEKARKIAKYITIGAVIILGLSAYSINSNFTESTMKSNEINSLVDSLSVSNDSISQLKKSLSKALYKFDTIQNSYNELKHKIDRTKYPFYSERIELDDGQTLILDGILSEGMRIEILESNCNHSITFIHNQKILLIKEDQSGFYPIRIGVETGDNKTLFKNEGNAPCGMIVEIYSSQSSSVKDEKLILFKVQDDKYESNLGDCPLADFESEGTWQMIMDYNDCMENDSNIKWSKLTTYFSIEDFELGSKSIKLNGDKFAENYNGEYKEYSKMFPITSSSGYLKDCEIIVPFRSEYGNNKVDQGTIKIMDIEKIDMEVFLHGEFTSKTHNCRGRVTFISN